MNKHIKNPIEIKHRKVAVQMNINLNFKTKRKKKCCAGASLCSLRLHRVTTVI